MDAEQFWKLIEEARSQVADPGDGDTVALRCADLLAARPREEIVAAQQVLCDLLADSYRNPLWAAAYILNGGCSDDGFDYFRGWLVVQGREVFERAVRDPDSLADLPAISAASVDGTGFDCGMTLGIAWNAHVAATGEEMPGDAFTIRYPDLDPGWDFDFDDDAEMARRLPRLAALHLG